MLVVSICLLRLLQETGQFSALCLRIKPWKNFPGETLYIRYHSFQRSLLSQAFCVYLCVCIQMKGGIHASYDSSCAQCDAFERRLLH